MDVHRRPIPSFVSSPAQRLVALAAVAVVALGPVEAQTPHPTVSPAEVGAGELLWDGPDGLVPLPIVKLDVELDVTGIMLRGRVAQTFENPLAETIEVVYVFPLPDRAAVHHMEIRIGDRRIVSTVQEKRKAQETYEIAKSAGRKAAIVEQDFGALFSTRAANVGPGESIVVVLEYFEEVAWTDGSFGLRFPLTYVPRFTPPSPRPAGDRYLETGRSPSRAGVPTATLRVMLDAGMPLAAVTSASHAIATTPHEGGARIRTDPGRVPADRDFVLRWTPERAGLPDARVLIEDRADGRYGLVMLLPPDSGSDVGRGLPTETLFIVDVSGSMNGPPLRQAREALLAALERLRPEDRFNIIRFSDKFATFSDSFVHAEGADLAAAREWVRGLHVDGGTMILPALVGGMELLGRSRSTAAQRIVFLTDGAVSNEPEILDAVVESLGDARLHTIGIGHAPNTWLMRKMAWHGRGLHAFIADVGEAANGIDAFFSRLERPVLEDVRLSWDGDAPLDAYPARVTDLHADEPLYVSFRLAPGAVPPTLTVGGYSRVGRLERTAPLDRQAKDGAGLAVRWAGARVDALMDDLHEGADPDDVRDAVVAVALDFNLVTLYTSLVAVDHGQDDVDLSGGTRRAALLPQGGTDAGLRLVVGVALLAFGLLLLPIVGRSS